MCLAKREHYSAVCAIIGLCSIFEFYKNDATNIFFQMKLSSFRRKYIVEFSIKLKVKFVILHQD